jgi:MFS family permease
LIKWFPDKRGMATGMAIMGFGGGAMVGAPLAAALMGHFASADQRRRVAELPGDGRDLLRVHDRRRTVLPRSAYRLEA